MKRIVMLFSILLLVVPLNALAQDFCKGNFDYDQDVDGTDASVFKQYFGRSQFKNPCPADGPAPVERTWQSPSYAVGDDGWYHKGISWGAGRFTDNANGTITDNLTGLIWLKNANCWGTLTWSQALTYANGLVNAQCGLTDGSVAGDWRLPNIKELLSIVDYDYVNPPMWGWQFFDNVQSNVYWSSTSVAYQDAIYAWFVSMDYGFTNVGHKANGYFVWPVRGGH